MIIEGLLTTMADDGSPHVAPMGPLVDESLGRWRLRPFQTSTTFANLRRDGRCIFHVVDDVQLLVQAALSLPLEATFHPWSGGGWIIESACHWYALRTHDWQLGQPRAEVDATVLDSGVQRPFWGWNRAKHAVLEATILATRLHLRGPSEIAAELERLEEIVGKTAGARELAAWQTVRQYIRHWQPDLAQPS